MIDLEGNPEAAAVRESFTGYLRHVPAPALTEVQNALEGHKVRNHARKRAGEFKGKVLIPFALTTKSPPRPVVLVNALGRASEGGLRAVAPAIYLASALATTTGVRFLLPLDERRIVPSHRLPASRLGSLGADYLIECVVPGESAPPDGSGAGSDMTVRLFGPEAEEPLATWSFEPSATSSVAREIAVAMGATPDEDALADHAVPPPLLSAAYTLTADRLLLSILAEGILDCADHRPELSDMAEAVATARAGAAGPPPLVARLVAKNTKLAGVMDWA